MRNAICVSILGCNEIVREGLKRILIDQEFNVYQAVADPAQLKTFDVEASENHLIIIDVSNVSEAAANCVELRQRYPSAHIVLMVDDYSLEDVALAFGAGVDGYLVKAISCEPLGGALRLIAMGEKVYPAQMAEALADHCWKSTGMNWKRRTADLNLSCREIEILRCLVDGQANKVISRRLNITEATVKVHIKAILRKLRVVNRTQAAIWAVTRGLDRDEPAEPAMRFAGPEQKPMPLQVAMSH